MSDSNGDPTLPDDELARLTAQGVLGFYDRFEVTEVFATLPDKRSINVFTLLVAEEHGSSHFPAANCLNPDRIQFKKLAGWNFGVVRYWIPLTSLPPALDDLAKTQKWQLSGKPLNFGKLTPVADQFVPSDTYVEVPLNRILKNNFWNGSHVIEWTDNEKTVFKPFFDDSRLLQALSAAVHNCVPLVLAGLSDRLGNLVIQLPVTVTVAEFKPSRILEKVLLEMAWHPKATPRDLRVVCKAESDGLIAEYTSTVANSSQELSFHPRGRTYDGTLWDDTNQLILAASGPLNVIGSISVRTNIAVPEPRLFTTGDASKGTEEQHRVDLVDISRMEIGGPKPGDFQTWTRQRLYKSEASRLVAERRFVQYRPEGNNVEDQHRKALKDIHALINSYGQNGVWLWDPYLSANDVLDTLFYCRYSRADLRALTAALEAPSDSTIGINATGPSNKATVIEDQRKILNATKSNFQGIKIEYRAKVGQAGWGFHDRFLIFPETENGPLAWSLGTSVNSLGKQHHILQRADDGGLIKDAFVDLWEQLDQPEHLIWKKP